MNIKSRLFVVSWRNILLLMGILLLMACAVLYSMRLQNKQTFSAQVFTEVKVDNLFGNWKNFPGATSAPDGSVHFSALDRKIVNQDGSGGQGNPAVNVGGQHLQVDGDFSLSLTLSGLSGGQSTFRLYGEAPVIYDEWRHEGASISLEQDNTKLMIRQWDGSTENPAVTKTFSIRGGDSATISFTRAGDRLRINEDSTILTTLPHLGLFSSGTLWFGVSATGNGYTLDELAVGGSAALRDSLDSVKSAAPNALANLAVQRRPSLKIGAAVSLYPLMTNTSYREIALNQFSMWTPENEMKSQFIHPAKDTYSFHEADLLVATALKNNIAVHGHALVFGEANATWMQNIPKAQLEDVMKDHITTIMTHFKGKVSEWDVVNEPLDDYAGNSDGLRRSIWYNAMGESFIPTALKTARAADPDAKLYINEFGLEENGERWETFIGLIERLQAARVPLDGVGFQSHVYENGDEINPTVLGAHMQQLAAMGLLSRVSETDVHGEDKDLQAQQYGGIVSACLQQALCMSFSTWGISDAYGSTTSDHSYPLAYGNDLIWDAGFKPKKALQSIIDTLKKP